MEEKHRDALRLVGKILRPHVYCWEEVKDCLLLAANGPVKFPDDKYDGAGVFLSFFFFQILISEESACNVGDLGPIPGSGRFPGEGNGNPLQYSCLENPMDRGAWWASVHGVAKSQTQLSTFTFTFFHFHIIHKPFLIASVNLMCRT